MFTRNMKNTLLCSLCMIAVVASTSLRSDSAVADAVAMDVSRDLAETSGWVRLLSEASYFGTEMPDPYAPLCRGSFSKLRAVRVDGFVSCNLEEEGPYKWNSCSGLELFSFDLQQNNEWVIESPAWDTLNENCDIPSDPSGPIVCHTPITLAENDTLTPTWYEPRTGDAESNNYGTITINLYGYAEDVYEVDCDYDLTIHDFRDNYRPNLVVTAGDGDAVTFELYSDYPERLYGLDHDLIVTTGLGSKHTEDCPIDHGCLDPAEWDIHQCGANRTTMPWTSHFHDGNSRVVLVLETTLHELRGDCPIEINEDGSASMIVAVMVQDVNGVNRIATKLWKVDLIFNSETLATSVLWGSDVTEFRSVDIVFESRLDIMLAVGSEVIREAHTFFAGETVLVRHSLLNENGPYLMDPVNVWLSQNRNPTMQAMHVWSLNMTGIIPLNFKFIPEDGDLYDFWFCFEIPSECRNCYIHSLADVEILDGLGGEEGGMRRLVGNTLAGTGGNAPDNNALAQFSNALVPFDEGEQSRRLAVADESSRLQSASLAVVVLDPIDSSEAENSDITAAKSAGNTTMMGAATGVGMMCVLTGLVVAGRKIARRTIAPMPGAAPAAKVDTEVVEDGGVEAAKMDVVLKPTPPPRANGAHKQ